jgi:hypothetical protein
MRSVAPDFEGDSLQKSLQSPGSASLPVVIVIRAESCSPCDRNERSASPEYANPAHFGNEWIRTTDLLVPNQDDE